MRLLIICAFALGALSLIGTSNQSSAGTTEKPILAPQEDLAAQLKELEARVEKIESEKALLELKLEVHQDLMKEIFDWMATLPGVTQALVTSVENAREMGFEAAGPNPQSKKELLNGLKSFANSMNSSNPASKKSKKN